MTLLSQLQIQGSATVFETTAAFVHNVHQEVLQQGEVIAASPNVITPTLAWAQAFALRRYETRICLIKTVLSSWALPARVSSFVMHSM